MYLSEMTDLCPIYHLIEFDIHLLSLPCLDEILWSTLGVEVQKRFRMRLISRQLRFTIFPPLDLAFRGHSLTHSLTPLQVRDR